MSTSLFRRTRLLAGALLAAATLAVAGCGTATSPKAADSRATVEVDQSLHDLLPRAVRDRGVLRVGTDASYAPMESFAPDGRTIVGMDPDLATEIGRVLGVRVQFRSVTFTDVLGQVSSGDLDLAMSAITDTPARQRTVDFVNYFSAGTAIVVRRGNPEGVLDIEDLCGKVVAVERGTTQVDLLDRAQHNCAADRMVVRTFATNSDALLQLRTGRATAVLNDLPPAVALVSDPRTKAQYQLASTTQYEPGLYGIAVRKGRHGLRDAIQGALEKAQSTGSYTSVLDRWKVHSGAVDRISVNSDS